MKPFTVLSLLAGLLSTASFVATGWVFFHACTNSVNSEAGDPYVKMTATGVLVSIALGIAAVLLAVYAEEAIQAELEN